MKTKPALLRSIGALLLTLLALVALPCSTAHASQGQCDDVDITYYDGAYHVMYVELTVGNGCDIYLTSSIDNPNFPDPSRSGANPIPPTIKVASGSTFYVPYGHTICIKAFCYKPFWTQSATIYFCLSNPET